MPVSDLITSVAVVVSLIYLALEVRQNTRAIEGSAFQELIHASDASLLVVAGDSVLADIQLRGNGDFQSLTPNEQLRYVMLTRVYWRNWENAFLQYQRGLIGEGEWGLYRTLACNAKSSSWQLHESVMTPSFAEFVESC